MSLYFSGFNASAFCFIVPSSSRFHLQPPFFFRLTSSFLILKFLHHFRYFSAVSYIHGLVFVQGVEPCSYLEDGDVDTAQKQWTNNNKNISKYFAKMSAPNACCLFRSVCFYILFFIMLKSLWMKKRKAYSRFIQPEQTNSLTMYIRWLFFLVYIFVNNGNMQNVHYVWL